MPSLPTILPSVGLSAGTHILPGQPSAGTHTPAQPTVSTPAASALAAISGPNSPSGTDGRRSCPIAPEVGEKNCGAWVCGDGGPATGGLAPQGVKHGGTAEAPEGPNYIYHNLGSVFCNLHGCTGYKIPHQGARANGLSVNNHPLPPRL